MSARTASVASAFSDITTDLSPTGLTYEIAVAPRTMDEVAMVIAHAADSGLSVLPVGSSSSMRGGGADIALSTSALAGVIDYQPDDLTIVVGAGTTLGELEAVLEERGHTAVLPESSSGRTVGGVVASGASGYSRLRYGPTRDRVLEVTMATGYGEVIRAGGRLVKNVTGYDLSRLATGSLGSLGVIGSVCLKLWPAASVRKTVSVAEGGHALDQLYQPLAVLETDEGVSVYIQGASDTVASDIDRIGGVVVDGFQWPVHDNPEVYAEVRVPARMVTDAVVRVRGADPLWFTAHHGVGVIEVGLAGFDEGVIDDVRGWASGAGGSVVVSAPGLTADQRWGPPGPTVGLQRRLKKLFDPNGVCNPGVLPGGL